MPRPRCQMRILLCGAAGLNERRTMWKHPLPQAGGCRAYYSQRFIGKDGNLMKFKRLLAVPRHSIPADSALLLLRLVVGLAFMLHGWGKIQRPFSWMGEGAFAPAPFQALAALSEFGGGLALILGLVTPLACLGIASTMAVAFYTHAVMRGDPFVGKGASSELAAVYFCIAIVVLAMGPGRASADRALFGTR